MYHFKMLHDVVTKMLQHDVLFSNVTTQCNIYHLFYSIV